MTGHGFRSLAMGVFKERLGYRHEVVDQQLSHQSGDTYGEAYDRAEFKEERKKMMQQYADYLDAVARDSATAGTAAHDDLNDGGEPHTFALTSPIRHRRSTRSA